MTRHPKVGNLLEPIMSDPVELHRATVRFNIHCGLLIVVVLMTGIMMDFGLSEELVLSGSWLTTAIQELADYIKVL